MATEPIINTFFTDENVDGPAIELAIAMGVQNLIRDVDTDVPCEIHDYDQCLTDYAVALGYVVVTANIKDFAPKYKGLEHHPGAVFIGNNSRHNYHHIAIMLKLLESEDMTDRIEWI